MDHGWMRTVAVAVVIAIVIAVALPSAARAVRRNREYLHILRGDIDVTPGREAGMSGRAGEDDLLDLRRSLRRDDWSATRRLVTLTAGPDRLSALLVLHDADERARRKDVAGARAALGAIGASAGHDSVVWYRLGDAYERASLLDDAVQAFARGAAFDSGAPWTEGRSRIAMIYERQERWQPLADLLGPLLASASDADFGRTVGALQRGGAVWQGTFLSLGSAYEHLNRTADAEATYDRIGRLADPRRDWTLNRALVYLARTRREQGHFAQAEEPLVRALDLAAEYDVSFRREYELDTAAEADRLIDQGRRDGKLEDLRQTAEDLVRRSPQSTGAWYLSGLASEAACEVDRARSAYAQAARLVRPGAGAYLAGRPADRAGKPCPPR